eukprot:TRINITY_DN19813_c0_g1_i2.p1 TRINITY_DN19813_c0_g1~~TRINITY_DN19813_c0_g1_i2.p1  ORF type:complete len:108 (+),score=9.01 TRINITY_DN19813_c0_g1_i2:55-378(+)
MAQLNLLVVYCSDLKTSLEYYRSLGLHFVEEQHGKGPIHWSTDLDGCIFELYPKRKADAEKFFPPLRFGLALKEKNIKFEIPKSGDADAPNIVRDPDGNYIHLTLTP